ncbi:unnamed protein product [Vicia faba]|uniref:Uncharacterized protein n=1 Tax=Vicia faba TaxID=3906 RepID=A0AAV1BAM5_VICFA|nr:unnamed protein product [Vicia faba]
MMNGFDEAVDVGVNGEPRTETIANSEAPSEPVKNTFITEEMGKAHVNEVDYMTDELDSSVYDDNCDERPYVIRYATKIPGCRAFKARQIARQIVEGESSKTFSLLWSYGAELRKGFTEKYFQDQH